MKAQIDLSPALIRSIARGDPRNLPVFMVHDDAVWPWGRVQLDSLKRVHLRRHDFNTVVAPQIPTRPGLWLRDDLQQFHVDLAAHHLQGDGEKRPAPLSAFRRITEDRRRCPECGGWMHDVTGSPGARFCLGCNYGESPTISAPEVDFRRLRVAGLV